MKLSTEFIVSRKQEKQDGTPSSVQQRLGAIARQTAASLNGLFFLQDVVMFSANLPVACLSLDEADNLMLDDYYLLTGNKKHKCIPQLKPNQAH